MFIERIKKDIEESAGVKNLILNDIPTIGLINEIAEECINTLNKGAKLFFVGMEEVLQMLSIYQQNLQENTHLIEEHWLLLP